MSIRREDFPPEIVAAVDGMAARFGISFAAGVKLLVQRGIQDSGWSSPLPAEPGDHHSIEHARAGRSVPGFVYLMALLPLDGAASLFKIGYSVNPYRRLDEVCRAEDAPVELVCHIPSSDMRALESQLHQRYAHARDRGEWFRLSASEVEEIRGLSEVDS